MHLYVRKVAFFKISYSLLRLLIYGVFNDASNTCIRRSHGGVAEDSSLPGCDTVFRLTLPDISKDPSAFTFKTLRNVHNS
jgi:hypothetical protein